MNFNFFKMKEKTPLQFDDRPDISKFSEQSFAQKSSNTYESGPTTWLSSIHDRPGEGFSGDGTLSG